MQYAILIRILWNDKFFNHLSKLLLNKQIIYEDREIRTLFWYLIKLLEF